jgi:hypothetical protein
VLNHVRNGFVIVAGIAIVGIYLGKQYLPARAELLIFPIALFSFGLVALLNKFMFGKFLPRRGKPLSENAKARRPAIPTLRQLLIAWLTMMVTAPVIVYVARSGVHGHLLFVVFMLVCTPVFLALDKLSTRAAPSQ